IKSAEDIDESGKWFAGSASYTPKTEAEASHKLGYAVKAIPIREPFITKKDTEFHMQAISSTSGNPERAMMFLNLLYTDPYLYNLIAYGIEGKHYEKRASGVIEKPGNAYFVEPCTFGNSNLSYNLSYYPKNLKEELKSLNTKAIISPLLKFSFNPDKVESEIEKITDVTEEIEGPLFTGTVDPDAYLPKIIDKYKKAGLDKVMLEMQRQLDNWNSNRK
ncbi:MAG TPA: ABC transporter substrate-binding protein, partial [Clostridia bacterium]|nr:ABC transporter substrate-binding protein [Clostridia bacterium]